MRCVWGGEGGGEDGDMEGVILGMMLERSRGIAEGEVTFLPITPRQAIDGIAMANAGFGCLVTGSGV